MNNKYVRFFLITAVALTLFAISSPKNGLAELFAQDDGTDYVVVSGDTLSGISARMYGTSGRWREIFEATNARAQSDSSYATIENPSLIFTGQKFWIPNVAAGAMSEAATTESAMQSVAITTTESISITASNTVNNAIQANTPATPQSDIEAADSTNTATSEPRDVEPQPVLADSEAEQFKYVYAVGGPLLTAQSQIELIVTHHGFLETALSDDDLDGARAHAEHVVNILEGEAGEYFGDNDRNGQIQNPGDGIGVAVYLEEIQTIIGVAGPRDLPASAQPSVQEIDAVLTRARNVQEEIVQAALQIFAASTMEDAQPQSTELKQGVDELQKSIGVAIASGTQLLASLEQPSPEQAPSDGPLQQLQKVISKDVNDSALLSAQGQIELALTHQEFLQAALVDDDLEGARAHAEHVVNILEGEISEFFGDNDRNGQTQNPGDGIGIAGHLNNVQSALGAISPTTLGIDAQTSVEEIESALANGQKARNEAVQTALRLFAIDTSEEGLATSATLNQLLNELQKMSIDIFTIGSQLLDTPEQSTLDEAQSPLSTLFSESSEERRVLRAQEQIAIALTHQEFLQGSLDDDDLPGARTHAEHVVNILDGETGEFFGDNDRNGQAQNPGDGVGVLAHLTESQAALGAAIQSSSSGEIQDSLDEISTGLARSLGLREDALKIALRIFAVDTVDEGMAASAELESVLDQLQATVNEVATSGIQLLQP